MNEFFASPHLLYAFAGAILVGMGFFSLAIQPHVFRKILAWNALGSGVFLIFGAIARRNATEGVSDPLPQAIVITGIVVSVSATALALAIARGVHGGAQGLGLEPEEALEESHVETTNADV